MRLDIGAGNRRHRAGYVTLDADARMEPDIVALVPPIPLADESCEVVYSSHMIEHLTKDVAMVLIGEIWRVLMVGGHMEIVTPYALSPEAFQDPDHRSYWVPASFLYHTPHFAYLERPYEQRFQIRGAVITEDGEVHVKLQKTAALEDCECPICQAVPDVEVER